MLLKAASGREDDGDDDDDPDADADAKALAPGDLAQTMLAMIEEVNGIFQISPGTARILLAHNRWNKERLLERYYCGDQDKLFEEARVVKPSAAAVSGSAAGPADAEVCW